MEKSKSNEELSKMALESTIAYLRNNPLKSLGLITALGVFSGGIILFQYSVQNNLKFALELSSIPASLIWLSLGSIYITLVLSAIMFLPMLMAKMDNSNSNESPFFENIYLNESNNFRNWRKGFVKYTLLHGIAIAIPFAYMAFSLLSSEFDFGSPQLTWVYGVTALTISIIAHVHFKPNQHSFWAWLFASYIVVTLSIFWTFNIFQIIILFISNLGDPDAELSKALELIIYLVVLFVIPLLLIILNFIFIQSGYRQTGSRLVLVPIFFVLIVHAFPPLTSYVGSMALYTFKIGGNSQACIAFEPNFTQDQSDINSFEDHKIWFKKLETDNVVYISKTEKDSPVINLNRSDIRYEYLPTKDEEKKLTCKFK